MATKQKLSSIASTNTPIVGQVPTATPASDEITWVDPSSIGGGASFAFWWDWSNWAIDWTANVTITWSNNTYIVKNYTSISAGTAPRVFTITPTGCVLHIKVQGNVDLSNWTFDFAWKWQPWGNPWWSPAVAWQSVVFDWVPLRTTANGGTYNAWDASGWLLELSTDYYRAFPSNVHNLKFVWWCWGGWWCGSQSVWNTVWFWWAWWGCIIFEVAGNVSMAWATVNLSWLAWANAYSVPWNHTQAWWGGWGGWWMFIYYAWTISWSETSNILWGAWGANWAWQIGTPWQPWGWWAWAWGNGLAWTWHSFASWWATWAWGNGWVWIIVKSKVNLL